MVGDIRELGRYQGRRPSIAEVLEYLDTSLAELLKRGLWSQLLHDAGLAEAPQAPDHKRLAKGVRRLCHVDSADQIRRWLERLSNECIEPPPEDTRLMQMLYITLWGDQSIGWSLKTAAIRFGENPSVVRDLREILQYQLQHAPALQAGRLPAQSGPLTIHAQYTRDEILVGLGHWSLNNRPRFTEGVLHVATTKVDAFFVTLQKTEENFSPTTMYEDYLVSHDCFHCQSQSGTSEQSPTGQRYLQHRRMGYTPLLFVREEKELPSGLAAPYYYLGPCEYQSHTGGRPISIIWKLKHRVPARLFRVIARQNVG